MSAPDPAPPSRRDRTRPAELIGISAVIAVAVGVITFFATRNLAAAGVALGVTFIVTIVVFAMLLMSVTPRGGDDDQPGRGGH